MNASRYKSFTFNEHLFVISLDRETGSLKAFVSSLKASFGLGLPRAGPRGRMDCGL